MATGSVHTTATRGYLEPRLTGDDTVVVASESRDGDDAFSVARARLVGAEAVETDRLDPSDGIAGAGLAAGEMGAEEVILVPLSVVFS